MISWIKGELISSWQTNNKFIVLINCQGLGYEIQTIEDIFSKINSNKISHKDIILWLKHIKKEDTDLLFGFTSKDQRDFFVEILNIKGIGAQIGMSLLNKFTVNEIIKAIAEDDKELISSVQGIGQKMTERIILELKSKISKKKRNNKMQDISIYLLNKPEIKKIFEDVEITLQSLNYPKKNIKNVFPMLIKEINNKKNFNKERNFISFENFLKEAMNYLDNNNSNLDQ